MLDLTSLPFSAMEGEDVPVFVSVCGRVERIDVPEVTLQALRVAVETRFDLGGKLRFVSDEDGDPEVTSDEQLIRLVRMKQTLRVLIGDSALSELEQRMWQLRQFQWGFFQDELSRLKNSQSALRNETKQLRCALEQSARREVELTSELMNERRLREKSEQQMLEQHKDLTADLRREQRAREAAETAMKKDIEDARQMSLRFSASAERQVTELRNALVDESRTRGKNIEALLSEWASSQAEIKGEIGELHAEIEKTGGDVDKNTKSLLRETSAREAFEQFFADKIRTVEAGVSKLDNGTKDLDSKLKAVADDAIEGMKKEASERAAADCEIQWAICELRDRTATAQANLNLSPSHLSPNASIEEEPEQKQIPTSALSTVSTVSASGNSIQPLVSGTTRVVSMAPMGSQRPQSAGPGRPQTPPPFAQPTWMGTMAGRPVGAQTQPLTRSGSNTRLVQVGSLR